MTALFLVVVLAGLGLAIVSFSTAQHTSSAMDVQGARAYQAARAGIEWAMFQFKFGSYCTAATSPQTNTFAMPSGSTLSSFTVTVTCVRSATPAGFPGLEGFSVTAVACNQATGAGGICPGTGGNSDYIQRVVNVRFQAGW